MKTRVKVFLFIGLWVISHSVFAQDIIMLKTGDEIKAIVQEVGIEAIKYKKFTNADGPTYTLQKSNVFMVKYQNGAKDVFSQDGDKHLSAEKPMNTDSPRNAETPKSVETPKKTVAPKTVEKPKTVETPKRVETPKTVEMPRSVENVQTQQSKNSVSISIKVKYMDNGKIVPNAVIYLLYQVQGKSELVEKTANTGIGKTVSFDVPLDKDGASLPFIVLYTKEDVEKVKELVKTTTIRAYRTPPDAGCDYLEFIATKGGGATNEGCSVQMWSIGLK